MHEIEAKVPLKKADVKRLRREIPRETVLEEKSLKTDDYYGKTGRFSMRIRRKNEKAVLTLKQKRKERGIEVNREAEFPIRSKKDFERWLRKIGIVRTAQKRKESAVYRVGEGMKIELNHVRGVGDFLEIEILTADPKDIPGAKKRLRSAFRKWGFGPNQFEKKPYLELLQERRKNQ